MDTQNIEAIYQKVADKVNEMIPELWDKAYLYAFVDDKIELTVFDK